MIIPTLPVELIYRIFEEAWCLPLSRKDRRDLLVVLPSICRSFRSIANRVFLRDAHIISPAYATHFLTLLQQQQQQQRRGHHDHKHDPLGSHLSSSEDDDESASSAPCRSITFHIYSLSESAAAPSSSSDLLHLYKPSNPMTDALESTLRSITRDALLAPALTHIALHYTNWSFTHELEHARLVNLPPHVQSLELHFSTPPLFVQHLRQSYFRHYVLPMPGVRKLRIFGTCPGFVYDVARACPALESLETDDAREILALLPSLRPFILHSADDDSQLTGVEPSIWGSVPEEAPVVFARLHAKVFGDQRKKHGYPNSSIMRKTA
jgi:hypothetical protein